jgi:hypothetical protein
LKIWKFEDDFDPLRASEIFVFSFMQASLHAAKQKALL